MKRYQASKTNIFFLEAILVVGCMSVISALMIQLFVQSNALKTESYLITRSTIAMQSLMEELRGQSIAEVGGSMRESGAVEGTLPNAYELQMAEDYKLEVQVVSESLEVGEMVQIKIKSIADTGKIIGELKGGYYLDEAMTP